MKRLPVAAVVLVGVLFVGGCRRTIQSEGTHNLSPGAIKSVDLPAAKSISAEFSTSDNVPVASYLVKTEDATTALDAVNSGKSVREALALIKPVAELPKQASGKFNSPRTENSAKYSILFTTDKATSVTVKSRGE